MADFGNANLPSLITDGLDAELMVSTVLAANYSEAMMPEVETIIESSTINVGQLYPR